MVMPEGDERPADPRRSPLPAMERTIDDRPRRRTVLIVDDDQQLLTLAVRSLRTHGHDVRGAASGREALLALYGGGPVPALLVTDVDMPGMTGIELAARVAADRPGVAIVLMTGNPTVAEMARERPELIRDVLPKPFPIERLVELVDDIVGPPGGDPDT